NLINDINIGLNDIDNITDHVKNDFELQFNQLISKINSSKDYLIEETKNLEKNKDNQLKNQLNLILEYQDELNYSIKRYKELINNSKLDVHLRRLEILKIFDKTVNKNNVPLSIITE